MEYAERYFKKIPYFPHFHEFRIKKHIFIMIEKWQEKKQKRPGEKTR